MTKKFLLALGIFGGAAGLFLFFLFISDAPVPERVQAPHNRRVGASAVRRDMIRQEVDTFRADAREEKKVVRHVDNDTVLVTRVVDGDTIEIEGGEHVRYIGMNTPESVDPRRSVQCFGHEASDYNKKLVEGKRVRLEPDVEDRDKYHRLLRYVWQGDTMINEKLVADGYAQVMTIPPNVKYVDRFRTAQTDARDAKRGLWAKCKK